MSTLVALSTQEDPYYGSKIPLCIKKMQKSLEKELQRLWYEMYRRSLEYSFMSESEGAIKDYWDYMRRERHSFERFPLAKDGRKWGIKNSPCHRLKHFKCVFLKGASPGNVFQKENKALTADPWRKLGLLFLLLWPITSKQRLKRGSVYLTHSLRE